MASNPSRAGVKGLKVRKLPEISRLERALFANKKKIAANQKDQLSYLKAVTSMNVIGYMDVSADLAEIIADLDEIIAKQSKFIPVMEKFVACHKKLISIRTKAGTDQRKIVADQKSVIWSQKEVISIQKDILANQKKLFLVLSKLPKKRCEGG